MTSWPIEIDGREYEPIPESWIDHGTDDGHGSPRLYAVSAAVYGREMLSVRYLHPSEPAVLEAEMRAEENAHGDGHVPAMLAKYQQWPRSVTPDGQDPTDISRQAEVEHLRTIWGQRVEQIPTEDDHEQLMADGGRRTDILELTDPERRVLERIAQEGGRCL
jgi:hypothetical protein